MQSEGLPAAAMTYRAHQKRETAFLFFVHGLK